MNSGWHHALSRNLITSIMASVVGIVEDNKKIRDLIQRYLDMQDDLSCPVAVD